MSQLAGGTPVKGGTFTLGVLTQGSEENVFPGFAIPNPDCARDYALYNLLFYPNDGDKLYPLVPGLALSAESDTAATMWTFKLRSGVTWHDGKPFGADDVVYNLAALWSDPSKNYSAGFLSGLVDFANVKAIDNLTVQIPLKIPSAQFPSIFAFFNFGLLQKGATAASTAKNPIGTGPFKFQSFTPGQKSVFVRNENYWEQGKPYVDTLVIDSSFTDNNAMLNALLSGQLNLLASPALAQVTQQVDREAGADPAVGERVHHVRVRDAGGHRPVRGQPDPAGVQVDDQPSATHRRRALRVRERRQRPARPQHRSTSPGTSNRSTTWRRPNRCSRPPGSPGTPSCCPPRTSCPG